MTGNELRKKFLDYFKQLDHTVVPSYPLVPRNDPTLLFTNAGMVQFKNVFLGEEDVEYTRAASSQKCVRAGGKHNDLEMVGRTSRHHTFFEMLGNFSFGDYFKREAIVYGWEFLTKNLGIPKDRLYASVFQDDQEAFAHWKNDIHLPTERIYRMGEKDNFWAMGNTGPCGPCSEIYIDQGKDVGCGRSTCEVGCECDRFLEIWNLVFMQYGRDESGKLTPLPKPCIDTGMGLERLAAVVQGRTSNYDCDLLRRHIDEVCRVTGREYGADENSDVSIRVITDHARATAFLIGDGVLPSNEGRGYVLRRIMRRALRHGKLLNQRGPFFHQITAHVVNHFKETFPDLEKNAAFIQRVVLNEEDGFGNTLTHGTQRLEEILDRVKKEKQTVIPGAEVFKLYDTFGFPVDLVEETAKDTGLTLDMDGFNQAMQEQKEKAASSWKGSGEKEVSPLFNELFRKHGATRFTGYEGIRGTGRVLALLKDHQETETARTGDTVEIVTDQTPFYGESGGQVGDTGTGHGQRTRLDILACSKPLPHLIVHKAKVVQGTLNKGEELQLEVDPGTRNNTALNHSATHLLHAALKEVLGEHVKQAGSLVAPDRLRFDYTHFSALSEREKARIESRVNQKIRENIAVETREMEMEEALLSGAVALFGEKYGDRVRVVNVPGFSQELCGGTHVSATGNIGLFKIVSESSVASGVRRIEAVTGEEAYERSRKEHDTLATLRALLKAGPEEELAKLKKLLEKSRELEKDVAGLKERLVSGKGSKMADDVQDIGGVAVLVKKVDGMDAKTLRTFIDNAKNQLKSGVIVVGSQADGKVLLAAGVTQDLIGRFHAGDILKGVAGLVGGSGGGRADMAQAGGTQTENIDLALQKALDMIKAK